MSYKLWKFVGYLLVGAVLSVCLLMLYTQHRHAPSELSTGGTVVFVDDFERASLGEHYKQGVPDPGHKAGQWRIQEFCTVKDPGEGSMHRSARCRWSYTVQSP